LTACEWLDVFVDQQKQVRGGIEKSGYWLLDVAEAGVYEFELRRWPRELDRPLVEGDEHGWGAIPIEGAGLFISDYHHMSIGEKKPYGFEGLTKDVESDDTAVVFTVPLEEGPMALHTWFHAEGTTLSAYYVYVTRK